MVLQPRKSIQRFVNTARLMEMNSEINRLNLFMAQNKGYSSAIDLWSVGCVSALMLTGSLAFNHRDGDQDIGQINSRSVSAYDLDQIGQGKHSWEGVPKKARKFVMSLLVLQEDKRSTAKKALEHDWFTNDICAERFDAVYQKSIRDWKPSTTHKDDIVVNIDTSDIAVPTPSASQVVRQRSDSAVVQSGFFQSQGKDEDNQGDMSSTPGRFSEHEPDSNILLAASPASQPWVALQSSDPRQDLASLQPSAELFPPESSDPDRDLDSVKPSAHLRKLQASPELTWPSSPPNNRRTRFPSPEFPWS
jgi:serine/threonine protein kinase